MLKLAFYDALRGLTVEEAKDPCRRWRRLSQQSGDELRVRTKAGFMFYYFKQLLI